MEYYVFVINKLLSADEEEFEDSFLNKNGGYTYMRSDGSALTFKLNDEDEVTEFAFHTKIGTNDNYDEELTQNEAHLFATLLYCTYGSDTAEIDEVMDYLDEIINLDFEKIHLGVDLDYGDYICEFNNTLVSGASLTISFKE